MTPTATTTPARARLAIVAAMFVCVAGCRAPDMLRRDSVSAFAQRLSPFHRVAEAEHHHEEVNFLEEISQLPHDPALDEALATFEQAEAARHEGSADCVSLYAQVAMDCWPHLPESRESHSTSFTISDGSGDPSLVLDPSAPNVAWRLYHHSLQQMTQSAVEHGTIDLQRGIPIVTRTGQPAWIAISHHGFPWQPDDFSEIQVVSKPVRSHLKRYWTDPGIGVPLIAIRRQEEPTPHMGTAIPYAATAVLRPSAPVGMLSSDDGIVRPVAYTGAQPQRDPNIGPPALAVLELHDPLRVTHFADTTRQWDLARDVSAPLGLAQSQVHRHNLKSFLNPDQEDEFSGLRMLEPYQRGKIPILFVHGLLSDRVTWIDLINDLRHSPWISRHYQIWLYQYSTGEPFIVSAADMRETIRSAIHEFDPEGTDPALNQMVLVGHSMGGLVSKLMITTSGDALWNSIANAPPDQVKIAPEKRAQVNQIFFFQPLPCVQRVVFIGSPHQGSEIAKSWIGILGSSLVHRSKQRTKDTKTILHDNPGVFKDLEEHLPTSVDLLRPDNPILNATYRLPVAPNVRLHTIIGTAKPLGDGTPADGVVPVASAQHPGTLSERRIDANHTGLPDHPETTREIVRILTEHIQ